MYIVLLYDIVLWKRKDSIMDEISVFVEENIEAEILDEMWEMR